MNIQDGVDHIDRRLDDLVEALQSENLNDPYPYESTKQYGAHDDELAPPYWS